MFVKIGGHNSPLLQISVLLATSLLLNACKEETPREIPEHTTLMNAILDSTNDLLNAGKAQASIHYLDSACQQIQAPGILDRWKKYNHKVGFYLYYDFNLKKARLNADSMYLLLKGKEQKYKTEYTNTIFAQGHILLAERRYAAAFKHYYDGRTFAHQYLDSCSYCEFTGRLGFVRYSQGQYLKAIPYMQQALVENNRCEGSDGFDKHFSFRQSILTAIALSYEKAGVPDSAIHYYQNALAFIDHEAHKYPNRNNFIETARGVIYGNLGGAYAKRGQQKEAEHYLTESIRINSIPDHDFQDAQTAKLKLADLYVTQTRFSEAAALLDQLESYLGEKGNNPTNEGLRLRWYKIKWRYFDQTGQYLPAYSYIQQYQQAQDSVNLLTAGLKEIDMDAVFKETEQQYKLALLQKNNELKTGYLLGMLGFVLLGGIIFIGVWYSLKRSRELNNKLAQKNEQLQMALGSLEQSQQENTRMMKIVAHDLRNPVSAVVSIATLLLGNEQLPQDDRELLELMKSSSLHSLDMIANLLNMNVAAEGIKKGPVEIHTLLHYCIDLLKFKSDEKKQTITWHTLEIVAHVNREKIWSVFSNLIVNAIKFSPEGTRIHVAMHDRQDTVLVTVTDQGIGIPDHLKDSVFNMFTDAKREGTAGEQPFGLGLAISSQIIAAHEGKIWFENNPDRGTTFYVELPKRS